MAKEHTILDFARPADVSIGKGSNVLNAKPNVNRELSARVSQAVATLGYLRKSNAASFRRNQTDVVGVIVPNIENAFT